jgi:hypothetical protein
VRTRIPVTVKLQRPNLQTLSQEAEVLVMNAHGALLLLAANVSENEIVTLVNSGNEEQVLARVTQLGPSFMGKAEVGIEFIKPSPEFWRIITEPR